MWQLHPLARLSENRHHCTPLSTFLLQRMKFLEDNISTLGDRGVKRVSPFTIPYYLSNMSAGMIAMEPELGFRGPNYSINTACATSNYCFINAAEHIRSGQSDVIIAGGAEAPITMMGMAGFIACKALSARNDEPQRASRPWDKQRDGFVMGEGAGILVLESLEHAKQRGATIYAEYLGGGVSCDAYDLTSPRTDGRDVILCMQSALDDAGTTADKVDLVNAHGTSTPVGDLCEVSAINSVFGEYKDHVKIHSTKSMTGHSLGAAGALEGIAMLMAIRTGRVHPTINHEEPEEGVEFNVVPNEAISMDVKVGLSNSFGFGGHNSSVIFGQYKE
uniref:beta-ketoacyl-[acyl-carrier-protein] synthase I n=1 Tax=Rhodosorus marinus TaxID=101924 RepID=A0A6T6K9G0_9RHOD|mmetsp:Transcript_12311/g.17875  ORF Transcript_12311/g.17875 Transcript_12311/m.17875 type:complete len:333 (+) Transcript_12311:669-1667(+)